VNIKQYATPWENPGSGRVHAQFRVRPIRPDDAEHERRFLDILRPGSRYDRFMCTMHEPPSSFIQQLVNVDYQQTMALVAVMGAYYAEQILGVARYAASHQQGLTLNCEFVVAVADVRHLHGVGTTLMRLLFDYARSQGFIQAHGLIFAANTRIVEFAHDRRLIRRMHKDWDVIVALDEIR
jgi:acetyltransferase